MRCESLGHVWQKLCEHKLQIAQRTRMFTGKIRTIAASRRSSLGSYEMHAMTLP